MIQIVEYENKRKLDEHNGKKGGNLLQFRIHDSLELSLKFLNYRLVHLESLG
jgi:hypothetical protein